MPWVRSCLKNNDMDEIEKKTETEKTDDQDQVITYNIQPDDVTVTVKWEFKQGGN